MTVQQALRELPPEYMEPLVLCDMQQASAKEAAEFLKISVPALKSRLYRGRRALKTKLGGALEKMESGRRASEDFVKQVEANRDKLQKYEDLCREIGHPPGEVALAWLLHNPIVTAPIIGPRTMEQLESAVRATEIVLDDETLAKLDEIFPGPGGEAPMAYAW